jgi:hypothetical protein
MWWYGNVSAAAWVYLALHGSYGLVWLLKDHSFPDPNWQRDITLGGSFMAFAAVLGWYWVFGWLLISGVSSPTPTRCRTRPGLRCASACIRLAA